MIKNLCNKSYNLSKNNNFFVRLFKRSFLSESYKCIDEWENRLKHPIFKKSNVDNIYNQLKLDFDTNKRISVLDVDILANSFKDYNEKFEVEDTLKKLRECPECVLLPERSTHAILRYYIDHGPKEDIFNLLSNRLEYGVFPDFYLINMLMDKFLKNEDYVSAVKIAVLQMLQEEYGHPITKYLAIFSCYKYLLSSMVWSVPPPPEPDPDEDVVKVRVPYIRNPYFDDHFDITEPNHLVGKTMWLFGKNINGPLGISSQLVGLILYEKFNETISLLNTIIEKDLKLHSQADSMAKDFLKNKPKQDVQSTDEENQNDNSTTEAQNADVQSSDSIKNEILQLLTKINSKNLLKTDLLTESENLLKHSIENNERNDIDNQCKVINSKFYHYI